MDSERTSLELAPQNYRVSQGIISSSLAVTSVNRDFPNSSHCSKNYAGGMVLGVGDIYCYVAFYLVLFLALGTLCCESDVRVPLNCFAGGEPPF